MTENEARTHLHSSATSWRRWGAVFLLFTGVYFCGPALTHSLFDRVWPDPSPTSWWSDLLAAAGAGAVFVLLARWWEHRTLRRVERLRPGRVTAIGRTVTVEVAGGTVEAAVDLPRRHTLTVGDTVWVAEPVDRARTLLVTEHPVVRSSHVLRPKGRSSFTPAARAA